MITTTIRVTIDGTTQDHTLKPSRYQQTHYPVSRLEILCWSRKPLDPGGFCPDCGWWLKRGGHAHKPNRTGVFGWVEVYADDSVRVISGDEPMPWCRVCEQANVPAIHRTPLGHDCSGEYGTGRHR